MQTMETINCLLFDLTKANLDLHKESHDYLTGGYNILPHLIDVENHQVHDSPIMKQVQVPSLGPHGPITNDTLENLLGLEPDNLLSYNIFSLKVSKKSYAHLTHLNQGRIGEIMIFAQRDMFNRESRVFEIRYNFNGEWLPWQAISGRFLVCQNYRFGPGGIGGLFNSMEMRDILKFAENFQIRYSGTLMSNLGDIHEHQKIGQDPLHPTLGKVIDPFTKHILFDSQIIHRFTSEESMALWMNFDKRYR